jgi:Protein of unknown function (DUF3445).
VHYAALPHMMEAQWDLLELLMESYSRDYPEHFTLEKKGSQWHWINRPLQIDQTFTFGEPAPCRWSRWSTSPARPRASSFCSRSVTIPW